MNEQKIITLGGDAAIALWLQGADEWNEWVKLNPTANVDFSNTDFANVKKENKLSSIDFSEYIFPSGEASFDHVLFGEGGVSFEFAIFGGGGVSFDYATFEKGNVSFNYTKFGEGEVSFCDTTFGVGDVSFNYATFGVGDVFFARTAFEEGNVSFVRAIFGNGSIGFSKVDFGKGHVSFYRANFGEGDVSFDDTIFGEGNVWFVSIKSEAAISFEKTDWLKTFGLSFQGATLNGALHIDPQVLNFVPDFRNSIISKKLTLHDVRPELKRGRNRAAGYRKIAKDPEDASRFLRLIELATDNHDHLSALVFKANFMRAKRWVSIGFLPSILDTIVDLVSNYGQSIMRPIAGLLILFLFLIGYHTNLDKVRALPALEYVLASSFPFLSNSKFVQERSLSLLYGGNVPEFLNLLTFLHGGLSLVFIFLIGLGLRNRFKL